MTYRPAPSIVVENVTKTFTLRYHRTFKQMTVAAMKRPASISDTFLAVDDVSFTVEQGESIGLMGLNGSGKSTLLKLINGIMRPDGGKVLTRGRIAGLIATGAGFHPQLTGRENVYLNAAILGMTEAETRRKFDDIVEFADIGRFLDSPVGHYSSGMFARLGFAVAIHVDSDIFLADEVLAVGDRPFKKKCMAEDAGDPRQRPHARSTSATPPARCARCATGCWSSRRAGSASTATSTRASSYLKYDDDDAENEPTRTTTEDATRRSAPTSDAVGAACSRSARRCRAAAAERACPRVPHVSAVCRHGRAASGTPPNLTNLGSVGVSSGNYRFVVTQILFRCAL